MLISRQNQKLIQQHNPPDRQLRSIFFPTSRLTQEKEKFGYRQATYKIRRRVFCPMSRSSQESEGFFYQRATYKGRKYKKPGSRGVRQGWSVAEKKRKEKDQGRWYVATRRGREKEEKKKTKEGEKVAPQRQGSVCPTPRISVFGSQVFGF